jgi:phosphoglycolate phosphatase-like HAD superfamily hydrolase
MNKELQTLIFDCKGILVDTERDGHRVSFNQDFSQVDLMVSELGDTFNSQVTLETLNKILANN